MQLTNPKNVVQNKTQRLSLEPFKLSLLFFPPVADKYSSVRQLWPDVFG